MWTTIKQTISKRKIKHNQLGKHVCSNARFQYRSYIYVYINVRKVTISSVFFKWMGWVLYCLHCRNLFLKFSLKHSHCQLFQCTIFSLFFFVYAIFFCCRCCFCWIRFFSSRNVHCIYLRVSLNMVAYKHSSNRELLQ